MHCIDRSPDRSSVGRVLIYQWDQCGEMLTLAGMGGMDEMGDFYDHCLVALYPPGSCGSFCTGHTYDCYMTQVHEACCDEAGTNCNAESDVPNTCPVGCAIVFPEFLEICHDHVEGHEATISTMELAEFEEFEHECLTNDGLALVEYALDMKRRGCFVNLRGDSGGGETDTGSGGGTDAGSGTLDPALVAAAEAVWTEFAASYCEGYAQCDPEGFAEDFESVAQCTEYYEQYAEEYVRYIVEAHGGTITVDSVYGQGTTFTVTFPNEPPPGAGAAT